MTVSPTQATAFAARFSAIDPADAARRLQPKDRAEAGIAKVAGAVVHFVDGSVLGDEPKEPDVA